MWCRLWLSKNRLVGNPRWCSPSPLRRTRMCQSARAASISPIPALMTSYIYPSFSQPRRYTNSHDSSLTRTGVSRGDSNEAEGSYRGTSDVGCCVHVLSPWWVPPCSVHISLLCKLPAVDSRFVDTRRHMLIWRYTYILRPTFVLALTPTLPLESHNLLLYWPCNPGVSSNWWVSCAPLYSSSLQVIARMPY